MARFVVYLKGTQAFRLYDKPRQLAKLAVSLKQFDSFVNMRVIDTTQSGKEYPLSDWLYRSREDKNEQTKKNTKTKT